MGEGGVHIRVFRFEDWGRKKGKNVKMRPKPSSTTAFLVRLRNYLVMLRATGLINHLLASCESKKSPCTNNHHHT